MHACTLVHLCTVLFAVRTKEEFPVEKCDYNCEGRIKQCISFPEAFEERTKGVEDLGGAIQKARAQREHLVDVLVCMPNYKKG